MVLELTSVVLDRHVEAQEETIKDIEKDLATAKGYLNGLILARNLARENEEKMLKGEGGR